MQQSTYKFKDSLTGKDYAMPWSSTSEPSDDDLNKFVYESEKKSLLGKTVTPVEKKPKKESLWSKINKPLTNIPSTIAKKVAPYAGLVSALSGQKKPELTSKFVEAVGDMGDSLSSPLSLGMTAASGGSSLLAKGAAQAPKLLTAAKVLNTTDKYANLGLAGKGAYDAADQLKEGDYKGAAGNVVMAGLGAIGLKGNLKNAKSLDKLSKTDEILPVQEIKKEVKIKVTQAKKATKNKTTVQAVENAIADVQEIGGASKVKDISKPKLKLSASKPDEMTLIPAKGKKLTKTDLEKYPNHEVDELLSDGSVRLKKKSQEPDIRELSGGLGIVSPRIKLGPKAANNTTTLKYVQNVRNAIRTAKPQRGRMAAMQARATAERVGVASKIKVRSFDDFYKQKGMLKGSMGKVRFTPIENQLTQKDINSALKAIDTSKLQFFEKVKAIEGFEALVKGGTVPQRSQLDLLDEIFGKGFGQEVRDLHGGLNAIDTAQDILNFPKAIVASIDMSAPLRQGLGRIHTREFWRAIPSMVKSWESEDFFKNMMSTIQSSPNYNRAQQYGLSLADREELFTSHLADIIPGVRNSSRAYTGFLNKLRMDTFDSLAKNIDNMGVKGDEAHQLLSEAATYVNNVTGRGSLGKTLNPASEALNIAFFSPRLIASRVNMLNPATYLEASPQIRKEYIKSALGIMGFGLTATKLGELALDGKVEKDPRSTDFGKLKIGNTRIDPWGGFQQYVVLASKLMTGEKKSSFTGEVTKLGEKYGSKTKLDTAIDFGIGKTAPVVALVATMLRGKDFQGAPADIKTEMTKLVTPLIIQDVKELYDDDPSYWPVGILGALGMGIQTYDKSRPKKKPSKKDNFYDAFDLKKLTRAVQKDK